MEKYIPVPNGTTSFWRTEPHFLDSHRSTESLPQECDIVVVGAGYAGASVVHHILDQISPGSMLPSIVILEARQACSGATGRNGKIGMVSCEKTSLISFFFLAYHRRTHET